MAAARRRGGRTTRTATGAATRRYDDARAAFGPRTCVTRALLFLWSGEGRACHVDRMEPFDFVQEHWVEIEAPHNGDLRARVSDRTTARVHQSTEPATALSHVSLSILVANVERTFFLRRGAALAGVDAFCGEHPPLETQNCAKLKNTLESLVAQLQENEPKPVLCFVVSDGTTSTERCDASPHFSMKVSKPGRYTIPYSSRCPRSRAGPRSARSVVAVNRLPGPRIRGPRHGSIVSTTEVELDETACVSVNGVEQCGTSVQFSNLPEGRNDIKHRPESVSRRSASTSVLPGESTRTFVNHGRVGRYVQRRMLANLVGPSTSGNPIPGKVVVPPTGSVPIEI